jgi:MFS transporter, AAHS family, 4-hydroxybenzoate transporter
MGGNTIMNRDETVDVQALIDGSPIGAYRIGVFVLCAFIAMVDGFDTQSIAFAAPAIAATWQVSPSQFGAAFGAALFGAMMGGIVLGPLGDRIGRRQILGIAMVIFGLASYGCAHSQTIQGLMLWRSVTGLGLGGAIPCLIAITSEFAPLRLRATVVTTMFCGFPIGALFGGLISAKLLETFDWTAIFALGAVLPLALLPFVLLFLPESLSTALARDPRDAGARNVLSKISGRTFPASTKLTVSADRSPKKVSPVELFSRKLWLGSTLIGVLFFATLLLSYFLVNWTPLLLRQSGMSVQLAIYGNVLMNAGGIVGGLLISRLTDRLGIIRILPIAYVAGALTVAVIGSTISDSVTLIAAFLAGLLCIGSQLTAVGVITLLYPPELCATGAGWTMAAGRMGSFLGPLGAGFLVTAGLSIGQLFWIATVPALIAACSVLGVGLVRSQRDLSGCS